MNGNPLVHTRPATVSVMGYNIEEAVEEWLQSISRSEIDEYLSRLELKREGSVFRLLERLNKWVLGMYVPEDFEEAVDTDDVTSRRTQLREQLIRKIVAEDQGIFVETSGLDAHPLEVILKSDEVLQIVLKTTGEAARKIQHPHRNQESDDSRRNPDAGEKNKSAEGRDNAEDAARRNANSLNGEDGDGERGQPEEMLSLRSTSGTEFQVPRDVGTLLVDLMTEVRSLRQEVRDQQRQATSSTRINDARPGQNVHADDTLYGADEREGWDARQPSPPPARPRDQAGLRDVYPAWEGGDRRNSARSTSWPNQNTQGTSANSSRSGCYHSRDIGQIVRKWKIRFSGAKSQSIDVFLARLEDCRVLANLTQEEGLSSLSELFTDTAATWYRNEKEKWTTWPDFLSSARRWYGPTKRVQQLLIAEANNRTQGEDEAVRDYIICLTAITRKISPPPSLEQQLDQLHRNLRPQLQTMVRRRDFRTVEELLELAVDAEQILENSRAYRPPPPPAATLLPEMAYRPPSHADPQRQPKEDAKEGIVAAAVGDEDPKPEDWEELLRRVLRQSLAEMASSSVEHPKKHASAGPCRGRGYQPSGRSEAQRPPTPDRCGKGASSRGNYAPTTYPEGNPPREQRPPLSCYSCGQLGYKARYCPNCSGYRREERVGGLSHTPFPNGKRKDTAAASSRGPAAQVSMVHSSVKSRREVSTKRPLDEETRWWLRVGVGESEVRALLDPGASTTVMGTVGLQLATALGCKFVASEKQGVRLPNGRSSPLLGHTILPITVAGLTRAIRVAIMPQLDADCYLGVNFVRAFRAVLDPDTDRLFCKEAGAHVELEVASLTTDPIAVYATGANVASDLQRKRLKAKAERKSPAVLMGRQAVERPWQVAAGDRLRPQPPRVIARYCPICGRSGARASRRCPDRAHHPPKVKKLAPQ